MPFGDSKLDFASPQSDEVQYDNGKIQLVAANMLAVAAKVKRSRTPGGQKRGPSMSWNFLRKDGNVVQFEDLKYKDQAKQELDRPASAAAAVALAKKYFSAEAVAQRGHHVSKSMQKNKLWATLVESKCVVKDCHYHESIRIPHLYEGINVKLMSNMDEPCEHGQPRQQLGLTAAQKRAVAKIRAGGAQYKRGLGARGVLALWLATDPIEDGVPVPAPPELSLLYYINNVRAAEARGELKDNITTFDAYGTSCA